MRNDILFAGLCLTWGRRYAKAYADKLHEMGYCAKDMHYDGLGFSLVAYSHRLFSGQEADEALANLEEGKIGPSPEG